MKNSIRILGATILAVVYCLALGIATVAPASIAGHGHQTTSQQQDQSLSTFSNHLYCHTTPTTGSVNSLNIFSLPEFKNPFFHPLSIAQLAEQSFGIAVGQCCDFFIAFLIQNRKSDIIFPFHYFW
ncbi:MAG: hypothetical protein KDC83_10685 [Flavobacteriales bacterium]|nr:hypothetical protein [Flavobacteriales bacterium]